MTGSLGKIGPTVMTEFLNEIEPMVMMRSLASKTVKLIIIITMTAASSTIPTIMHIAFVGLHFDDDGLTDFDFAEAVVISSIKSAYPLSVQLLILGMDPRLLTWRRVEQRDPVGRAWRQRRPNIHTNSKHFREFPIGCDLFVFLENGYPRKSGDSIIGSRKRLGVMLSMLRFFGGPYLRCLNDVGTQYVLVELHEGVCSNHIGAHTLAHRAHSQGYYWPTIKQDVENYLKIKNLYPTPHYPQSNRQIEAVNKTLLFALKKRTTPFALAYGMDVVISTEIGMPTVRTAVQGQIDKIQELERHLDWVDEVRGNAARPCAFRVETLVFRRVLENTGKKKLKNSKQTGKGPTL
ncbi:hypothetical protein AAG906_020988 [Vitis piasezkii]